MSNCGKIAIAGASGTLGQELIKAFYNQCVKVVALVRDKKKIEHLHDQIDAIRYVQVTQPETLKGCFKGCDGVVSTVGITRQRDSVDFNDVDYQANVNLLAEAKKAGLKKFVYISVVNIDKDDSIAALAAKHKFEQELQKSGMSYFIIRPSGFFSDLLEIFRLAKRRGSIPALADPEVRFTPIDPKDLAEITVEKYKEEGIIEVGGPQHLTYNQVADIYSQVLNKPVKVRRIPNWILNLISFVLKHTSKRFYNLLHFARLQASIGDHAQPIGKRKLEDFLRDHMKKVQS